MVETPTSHVPTRYDRDEHPTEFGRVLALSDGVFAIALTLLVLDIALPAGTGDRLGAELVDRRAHFFAFAISLLLVGTAWWSHHHLFSMYRAVNSTIIGLNIVYLGLVVLVPFAQSVLAGYPTEPLAYALFGGLLTGIGLVDSGMFAYAQRSGLLYGRVTPRAARQEQLLGAAFTLTFAISIPFAFLLGPYTGLIWLTTPVSQTLILRLYPLRTT